MHVRLRKSRGQAALRFIVAGGVLVFVFLLGSSLVLKKMLHRNDAQWVAGAGRKSPFDGERAFRDLEKVVAFGPRISGSKELAALREYIRGELEAVGLEVRTQTFTAETPIGKVKMVNLWGVVEGAKPGVIVIGNHYETKYMPEITFVGANDAGSTTAWMIEMARALGPKRKGRSVWLTFFDGEEAFKEWSDDDSLYGSRAFVKLMRDRGELGSIDVMINVDMIGDRYLGIHKEVGAPPWLTMAIWNKARELGYGRHFLSGRRGIEDDHIPFRTAGIPSIDIIDFEYGGSPVDHRLTWHTANDTIDKVSAGSLQAVGDVLYHALSDIEASLDST